MNEIPININLYPLEDFYHNDITPHNTNIIQPGIHTAITKPLIHLIYSLTHKDCPKLSSCPLHVGTFSVVFLIILPCLCKHHICLSSHESSLTNDSDSRVKLPNITKISEIAK